MSGLNESGQVEPDAGMHDTEISDDEGCGPYTCCRCLAATRNDSDWCDDCTAEAAGDSDV